jgi:hypothetical protein
MFTENRFMNVTAAAEAFHRTMLGDNHMMDQETFDQLRQQYEELAPEEHRSWLRGRFEHLNDASLAKRLRQLGSQSSLATASLIQNTRRWASTIADVRNDLTHLGSDEYRFSGEDLLWLSESVYSVVRICMVQEIGVDNAILTQLAESDQATWYRDRLAVSLERVRAELRGTRES